MAEERLKINVKYYPDDDAVVMSKSDWDKILSVLEIYFKKEEITEEVKG